jgi:hypothetical protein
METMIDHRKKQINIQGSPADVNYVALNKVGSSAFSYKSFF